MHLSRPAGHAAARRNAPDAECQTAASGSTAGSCMAFPWSQINNKSPRCPLPGETGRLMSFVVRDAMHCLSSLSAKWPENTATAPKSQYAIRLQHRIALCWPGTSVVLIRVELDAGAHSVPDFGRIATGTALDDGTFSPICQFPIARPSLAQGPRVGLRCGPLHPPCG